MSEIHQNIDKILMKKNVFVLIALWVSFMTQSCQKAYSPDDGTLGINNEILFSVDESAYVQTKATEYSQSTIESNGFKISAYNVTQSKAVFNNASAVKSGSYFKIDEGKYWPSTNDKYNFYAVYPNSCSIADSGASYSVSLGSSSSPWAGTSDFLVASTLNAVRTSSVNINFTHPLIYVSSVKMALSGAIDNISIKVKNVSITTPSYGTYSLSSQSWSSVSGTKTWTLCSTATTVSGAATSASPVNLATTGYMMIPNSTGTYSLTIDYDLIHNGVTVASNQSGTISGLTLKPGAKTTLMLTYNISTGGLSFSTTLSAWGTGAGYSENL